MKLKPSENYTSWADIEGETGTQHLMVFTDKDVDGNLAYRDEIVRRVNAHDALIECVSRYLENFDSDMSNEQVKQWLDREGIPAMRLALAAASETRTEGTPDAKQGTQGKDGE